MDIRKVPKVGLMVDCKCPAPCDFLSDQVLIVFEEESKKCIGYLEINDHIESIDVLVNFVDVIKRRQQND